MMNTMDSSTEGSQDNLWVLQTFSLPAFDETISFRRQPCQNTSGCLTTRLVKEHLCVAGTITNCLDELQNFSSLFLPWCKLGRICSQEAWVRTFYSSVVLFSLLYVYVSRLFGTLNGKAIRFFVHRYWFVQLFLSKCFFSSAFLSEINWLDTAPR